MLFFAETSITMLLGPVKIIKGIAKLVLAIALFTVVIFGVAPIAPEKRQFFFKMSQKDGYSSYLGSGLLKLTDATNETHRWLARHIISEKNFNKLAQGGKNTISSLRENWQRTKPALKKGLVEKINQF